MEHYDLVQEMPSIERMATQERLKHARKRRSQQLKKWTQYEKQLEKDNSSKKKKNQLQLPKRIKKSNKGNIKFTPNVTLLEAAARNDLNEGKYFYFILRDIIVSNIIMIITISIIANRVFIVKCTWHILCETFVTFFVC